MSLFRSFILTALVSSLCVGISAQASILGTWKTIDDKTGEPKSHIKIYEKDGKIFGRVLKLLPAATTNICNDCPGDKNGIELTKMDIIENLVPYKDYYSYGTIVDPNSGKEYKCSIWLKGNKLQVRGYIGVSLLGRTQVWEPLD